MSNKKQGKAETPQSTHHKLVLFCHNAPNAATNILFQVHNQNQAHIIFNRPQRMNAFTLDMYFSLSQLITAANQMEDIKFIVLRGNGGNFSSGNDLMNPDLKQIGTNQQIAEAKAELILQFSRNLINSKKPIFALVEGKCIGIVFAMLPLCDRVFATEDTYFTGPFVQLGLCPEVSSSYTFPHILGQALAEQVITKGKQITSKTLQKYNFLTCFSSVGDAKQSMQKHISQLNELDWVSYVQARRLMRQSLRSESLKAVSAQVEVLKMSWKNPQMPNIIKRYLSRQKSLRNTPRPKL